MQENISCEKPTSKKLKLWSEPIYLLLLVMQAASVALSAAANFGVSMIVAPAYILSLKFPVLTFGQWEYVVQGSLFILFCILMRKVKITYFMAFITSLLYGLLLDLFRLIPILNPAVTAPGSMHMALRILFFVVGGVMMAFSIALFIKVYLYPQIYDFFVIGLLSKFPWKLRTFKTIYDAIFLVTSLALSLIFFHGFQGFGVGTVILTLVNGTMIAFFKKVCDKCFDVQPIFKKFANFFNV